MTTTDQNGTSAKKASKLSIQQIQYKPIEVSKLVDPYVDTANLLIIDRDPHEEMDSG